MRITEYGEVLVTSDEVVVSSFTFEKSGAMDGAIMSLRWAISRIEHELSMLEAEKDRNGIEKTGNSE